ncbi:MAG: ribosome small subunit-dependent GTPase A [Candidatus Margulisbacteria bacterium]|nr:ribosome small subunit-dependent GTPase A [Candidatus Margulisiibacteriota bacterium]
MFKTLEKLGWNKQFAKLYEKYSAEQVIPARIIREDREAYLAHTGANEIFTEMSGKLLYTLAESERPKVGDWIVALQANDDLLVVQNILPRINKISRKAAGTRTEEQVFAANIDLIFIVVGLDHDFNLNRLERYLAVAKQSNAETIVVLNKTDICPNKESLQQKIIKDIGKKKILMVSAKQKEGVDELAKLFQPNKTGILLGSSGVGKSTLINCLLGENVQKTKTVREDDSKGRHITSSRQLFFLPTGGCLIDTPGMRELTLWSDQEGLDDAFSGIAELAKQCKFRNCTHMVEKKCAVQKAIKDGSLPEKRFQNYLKMKKELEYLQSKKSEKAKYEYKQKQKKLYQVYEQIKKIKKNKY